MDKSKNHSVSVSVVIPCFNERDNLRPLCQALSRELQLYDRYEILFVDDGSTDGSLALLRQLATEDSGVGYLQLSRNFGHQQALKAGLDRAGGDCVITMDGDLQHDPKLIHTLIRYWREEGYQVVYTLRDDAGQKSFKSRSSALFYGLLNRLSKTCIEPGSADFRLLDRVVVEELRSMSEHHLFLRGLIPWMGFRQKGIPVQVNKRACGQSKYSLFRMVRLAFHGITSFSVAPLRWSLVLGVLFALLAFGYGGYALWVYFFTGRALAGWTSVIASVLLLSGVQLIMMGIIGEYIGKIFEQVKQRPGYLVGEYCPAGAGARKAASDRKEKEPAPY